ncbi:MAG: peptidoglycan-binding protein [Frankiales bacterium]|nr:peptidoglycan-binding protein [Frankiales bacterium]
MAKPLTDADLAAETGTPLPQKEVMSLLDLNANIDLGLDLAAPVDLAVAANLNVAAPIDAAASANVLSVGSDATAAAPQQTLIDQHVAGAATANAPQTSDLSQGAAAPVDTPADPGTSTSVGDLTSGGNLLDVNVDVNANAHIAAPIDGAVAANANVAAPIDAAVSANVGSIDSHATAYAPQTAIINQDLDGVTADATATQDSSIAQGPPVGQP